MIRSIRYGADEIQYEKFDPASTERFKLGEWAPKTVTGGKMQWDPKSRVLTVVATAPSVTIRRLRRLRRTSSYRTESRADSACW